MQTKVTAELKTDAEGVDRECVLGGGERVGETTDLQTDLKCLLLQLPHLSTEISHIFPKKETEKHAQIFLRKTNKNATASSRENPKRGSPHAPPSN